MDQKSCFVDFNAGNDWVVQLCDDEVKHTIVFVSRFLDVFYVTLNLAIVVDDPLELVVGR